MKSKYRNKIGSPPGSRIHVGIEHEEEVQIQFIEYNGSEYQEKGYSTQFIQDNLKNHQLIGWLNIEGLKDVKKIGDIGECFGIHDLLIEDVLNTNHRPKSDDYDDYIFVSLKMLSVDDSKEEVISEQISLVLGKTWLISFQEQKGDIFDDLRDRLRNHKGKTSEKGADYLFYRLIDTVVDHYYLASEFYDMKIEALEDQIMKYSNQDLLEELQFLKKQVTNLKRDVFPLREAIGNLLKDDFEQISKPVRPFLKDVYDHVAQLHDAIEIQRENLSSLADLYHSNIGHKTNQIMQTLTVVATIFIPLTFIVGIYGMNFENMPELHWKYGYLMTWIAMAIVVLMMFVYFKRKKWW